MITDLVPPEGMSLEVVGERIAAAMRVRRRALATRDLGFYDSFDGLAAKAGLAVVYERGNLCLRSRNGDGELAHEPLRRPGRPLLATELPPGALRARLEPVLGVRALLPQLRIQAREHAVDVLDAESKTVARLRLLAPALAGARGAPGGHAPPAALAPRVRLAAVRGYDAEHERVRRALVDELGLRPAGISLADEALAAAGRLPPARRPGAAPERDQPAAHAVAAVLSGLLTAIELNLPGTLSDIDTEFLHDLRVAIRRSRAVQREFPTVFDPERLAHFRIEFRWLQAITSPTRDLDVHLIEFDAYRDMIAAELRADLDPVLEILRARRRRSLARMRRELRSERATEVLDQWRAELETMAAAPREASAVPVQELAGRRIRRVYRRMVARGRAIEPGSPREELHELRKQGKELRYLFELFGAPLFDPEVVNPLIRSLKTLQDVLGRHQDRAVQVALLSSLRAELARRPGGSAALVAVGALIQRLLDDEAAARLEFSERFAPFAARSQRRLVAEALR